MTTKRIVYRRSDGVVEIVNPAPKRMAELMSFGLSEDDALVLIRMNAFSHLPDRGFGPAEDWEVMEATDIPQSQPKDREFRNALEKPGMGVPIVNMTKARVIHSDRITGAKRALARDLLEREMEGEDINTEKAQLRAINVQGQINSATTPATLKAIWPTVLDRFRR
jgi:hypothetical protein